MYRNKLSCSLSSSELIYDFMDSVLLIRFDQFKNSGIIWARLHKFMLNKIRWKKAVKKDFEKKTLEKDFNKINSGESFKKNHLKIHLKTIRNESRLWNHVSNDKFCEKITWIPRIITSHYKIAVFVLIYEYFEFRIIINFFGISMNL